MIGDNSYFGQKGYTIPKKYLSLEELNKIKQDLTVKAYLPNSLIKSDPFQFIENHLEKYMYPDFTVKIIMVFRILLNM